MSDEREELARLIRERSRADESAISAMGANIVADAILSSDWLADHDRRVKAEALRESADLLDYWQSAEVHIGDPDCEGVFGASAAYDLYTDAVEDPSSWLRYRADRIKDES